MVLPLSHVGRVSVDAKKRSCVLLLLTSPLANQTVPLAEDMEEEELYDDRPVGEDGHKYDLRCYTLLGIPTLRV